MRRRRGRLRDRREDARASILTEDGVAEAEELLGIDNLYDPSHIDVLHHVQQALRAHALYQARRGLCGQGRRGDHRRRVHRPPDARAALVRRPAPGDRGQGRASKSSARTRRWPRSPSRTTSACTRSSRGMTGTAETEAEEFKKIYNLDVVVMPTNRPMVRIDHADVVYKTETEKFNAVVAGDRGVSRARASRCWSARSLSRSRSAWRRCSSGRAYRITC